jgi:hypothetical protein
MRSTWIRRLARLEANAHPVPTLVQWGWITALPKDYVGERHVVIVKRERTSSDRFEWCQFEERPGPAPDDAELELEEKCLAAQAIEQKLPAH